MPSREQHLHLPQGTHDDRQDLQTLQHFHANYRALRCRFSDGRSIESQLVHLVCGLDRAEFAPQVLCLYGPTVRDLHFARELHEAEVPLYLPDLGLRARDKLRAVGIIAATAWQVRPAIIQAEGYHANLLTRLAAPLLPPGTRLVGSLRGVHSRKQMRYERLSHRLCHAIVVNAPHLKVSLMRAGHMPVAKIAHIPNGIAAERYATPRDPHLRVSLGTGGTRVFVSLGHISFEKNLHWTAEALGLLVRQGRLPTGAAALAPAECHRCAWL